MNDTVTSTDVLFDAAYQRALFDRMRATYERMSTLSSFGFNRRWRRQLAQHLDVRPGHVLGDLMAGGGEAWRHLLPLLGPTGRVVGVDFSTEMVRHAAKERTRLRAENVEVVLADVLGGDLPAAAFDRLYCAYGVKTLGAPQEPAFVAEAWRLLRPGGALGLVEVSLPPWWLLRLPFHFYLFYLSRVIPLVGRLWVHDDEAYRTLHRYLDRFGDCSRLAKQCRAHGFAVREHSYFWGCATGLVAVKPSAPAAD